MGIRDRVAALLGVSTHRPLQLPAGLPELDDPSVIATREAHGGQLALIPTSQTRWYPRHIEAAELAADTGDLSQAAKLMRAARKDGVYSGVLSTRTGGLVRLPKAFRGDPTIVEPLKRDSEETRGIFDEMFPATELALLAADGLELGVAVAELVEVRGRDFPIMVRLDPEFLWYRWNENRWYYRSIAGMIPIVPGDGKWILHMPGGRVAPWQHGLWRAIGRAYIRKEHANLHRDNWEAKLANAARVAVAPQAASQEQKDSWFQSVMAWGVNTVFGMTPGYDVKLLESNGRGHESFVETIADSNNEIIIAVAGQTVTTDGGAGFQNSDIHKSIRADLIKETADSLAYTINTQGLPQWIIDRFGEDALSPGAVVEWDVTPPKDRTQESAAMVSTATAIDQLTVSLAQHGLKLDAKALLVKFGIPFTEVEAGETPAVGEVSVSAALDLARVRGLQPTKESVESILTRAGIALEKIPEGETVPVKIELAPTDIAKAVFANEARLSQGLPTDDRFEGKTIAELGEQAGAVADAESDIAVVEAEADAEEELQESAAAEPSEEVAA